MNDWVVCCDFDGTISIPDAVEYLLAEYADPYWKELDDRVWRGDLTERAAMMEQVSLIRASWTTARESLLRGVMIRDGFAEFVNRCRAHDLPIVILSSGLRILIEALLEKAGVHDVEIRAHEVEPLATGWRMQPYPGPRMKECCSHCKCVDVLGFKGRGKSVIYIGDGYTDLCPSAHADLLFATGTLARECERLGRPFHPFETFHAVEQALAAHPAFHLPP
ncbi:MtnX-like HAD-IB family phosphatase [candidate division KSB1 bacterium]|nr:MtnX-like HAD-IB family phosphatase [candidate division KSB1 bacterium]